MLVGLLIMRWVSPEELGLWNAVSIFIAYLPLFQLGIQSALNRELPILLGRKDSEQVEVLVKNSKGFALLLFCFFIIIGVLLSVYFFLRGKDLTFVLGLATVSIMAAFQSMQLHLIATFRSANAFNKLTTIYIIDTVLILGLIIFIYKFHYYGILVYNAVNVISVTTLMYLNAPYKKLNADFHFKKIISLAKVGVLLMSFIQLRSLAQSIPRWIVLGFGGVVKLGLFSPALALNGMMSMLPSQIAQFFHPQMGFKYGQSGNARDLWTYIKKILIIFPLISLPISIIIWILTPWLLETFFPRYVESEWPMKIMAVGFVFSSSFTTHGVLYTIKAFKTAYFYSFVELSGYFLFPFICAHVLDFELLVSVTIGLAFNNILLYFLNIYLLKRTVFLPRYNNGNIINKSYDTINHAGTNISE